MDISSIQKEAAQGGDQRTIIMFDFHGTIYHGVANDRPAYIDNLIVDYANKLYADGYDVQIASGLHDQILMDVKDLPDWNRLHPDLRNNVADKAVIDDGLKSRTISISLLVDDAPTAVMEVLAGRAVNPQDPAFRQEMQTYLSSGPKPGAIKP
jgi:hypothetical protein